MPARARRALIVVGAALALLGLVVAGFLLYAFTPYRADADPFLAAWRSNAIEITGTDRAFVIRPTIGGGEGEGIGLVFVPSARVESSAYLYKLSGIVATTGTTVVIIRPALNLPALESRALEAFTAEAPEIGRWIVGGHSSGGTLACEWALAAGSEHGVHAAPDVAGLLLLGSHCASDLSTSTLAVTSLVASNDRIRTPEDIAERANLLPDDTVTVTVEGANHSLFGDYGTQFGDGEASVSTDAVQAQITQATAKLVGRITR